MADAYKKLLEGLNIPAPKDGLEQRIIRAANHQRYATKPIAHFFTPLRMSLLTVTTSIALLWLMPVGNILPQQRHENGTGALVEKALDEEMDKEWGEQWLEVSFNGN